MEKIDRKMVMPLHCRDFSCIGGKCEDTCCAGWTVLIDEEIYKKYKKVKHPTMTKRLAKEIVQKRNGDSSYAAKIKLKNGRCAFLSNEGLCDIYSILGEKYLSHTCAAYPRTVNKVNDTLEYSLLLSCPEAARAILFEKEPTVWSTFDNLKLYYPISADIGVNSQKPERWQDYFLEIRSYLIKLLQNRDYGVEKRLMAVGLFLKEVSLSIKKTTIKRIPSLIEEWSKKDIEEEIKTLMRSPKGYRESYRELAYDLMHFAERNKIKSKRYEECLDETLMGLGIQKANPTYHTHEEFEKGYELYQNFLKDEGYILENYLVHYVFERCIPLDHEVPFNSFIRMQLYYMLMKLHMIGMANYYKRIDKDWLVKLFQSFSKTFDHDDVSFLELLVAFEEKNSTQSKEILYMIK